MKRIVILYFFVSLSISCTYSQDSLIQKICTASDYSSKNVLIYAKKLARKNPGKYNIDQICDVYSQLRDNWAYVSTYYNENIQSASESVETLSGNCVEFAVLMSCLIHDIGGSSRIVIAGPDPKGGNDGHAYCEVYLCNGCNLQTYLKSIQNHYNPLLYPLLGISDVKTLYYHTDSNGGIWLNLDWQATFPGGVYWGGKIIYIIHSDCTYEK
jgi:hypothetical protein